MRQRAQYRAASPGLPWGPWMCSRSGSRCGPRPKPAAAAAAAAIAARELKRKLCLSSVCDEAKIILSRCRR